MSRRGTANSARAGSSHRGGVHCGHGRGLAPDTSRTDTSANGCRPPRFAAEPVRRLGPLDAQTLFAPLGPTYDRYGALLSFGQDPRWRRFLVSRTEAGPGDRVLDVATGTGAVALELIRRKSCAVVGLDQSAQMLEVARGRLPEGVRLDEGEADEVPFPDSSFDALT